MTKADNPHLPKLQKLVTKLSSEPGVYRWLSEGGDVLYVGKAKNLKKRLQSYVQPAKDASLGPWKQALVGKIADVETTVTGSELEALVLETNLIKEIRPKYNVMMKDDKNYVYVRISTQDPYPAITVVRQATKDGATYFGPFLSSFETKRILALLQKVYNYRETKEGIKALNAAHKTGDDVSKSVRSLDFQIGQSCGVALGKITREEYLERLDAVMRFFKGNYDEALKKAMEMMQAAAMNKKFEQAAELRDTVNAIEALQERQIVSDTSHSNTDVFGIAIQGTKAQVVVFKERDGRLVGEMSFVLGGEAETVSSALGQFLPQFYSGSEDFPETIILGVPIEESELIEEWLTAQHGKKVSIHVPERGKKSKLLLMAEKNAHEKINQQFAKWEVAAQNIETALAELAEALKLPEEPKRIEGYDISHLGGTETVGSMVVVKNGKPANSDYRSFTIRTVASGDIDDYASLAETLKRRLKYLVQDLKQEEANWKEAGVTFGKARKAEQAAIEGITKEQNLSSDDVSYKDYIVARRDDNIFGLARLYTHKAGQKQLRSLWVDEKERGNRFGTIIVHKILHAAKKDKVYVIPTPELENYYSDLGFRHIHSVPKALQERIKKYQKDFPNRPPGFCMVYLPSENKKDASLESRPDLLVIDGGKGQLSTIVKVLKDLELDIPVIGLAKREEEVFIPGYKDPIIFQNDSQAKFLLMRLRDEAHRFANKLRESKGLKKAVHSALDDIDGIGEKTKKILLREFRTISGLRKASDDDLLKFVTKTQLAALRDAL